MDEKPIVMYKNLLWEILDNGSKLYILGLLIEQGFKGECKLITKDGVLEITDKFGKQLIIPIDILALLND